MRRLVVTETAERDLASVLAHTQEHWGTKQRQRYRGLIEAAFRDLARDPLAPPSRPRDDIRPGIRTFHIARHGQPARHLIVYRLGSGGEVEIVRVLHDVMELPRHVPAVE